MNIITDNHTVPLFSINVTCSHCHSVLELNDLKDFGTTSVSEGMQWDSYYVKKITFKCPLCHRDTKLPDRDKDLLPKAVVNAALDKPTYSK